MHRVASFQHGTVALPIVPVRPLIALLSLCIGLIGCARSGQAQEPTTLLDSVQRAYTAGRYAETISRLHRHRRRDSLSAQAHYVLGRSHQALGQHTSAVRALESALEGGLRPAQGLSRLAASYEALGRLERAEAMQKRALRQTPDDRDRRLRLQLAHIHAQQREWQQAAEIYRRTLDADSTSVPVRRRLADVLVQQDKAADAIEHYRTIHRARPDDARAAHSLSRLLLDTERSREALDVTARGLARDSTHAQLWRIRADAAFELDSLRLAERAYARLLEQDDTSATVLQHLGIVRVGQNEYHAALPPLRAAYKRDTTQAATSFYLATALRGVDSLDNAVRYYDRAIKYASEGLLVDALTQAARTHDARGGLRAALHDYRTALRLRPDRSSLYFHLATLYDSYYEDKTVAARYYDRFLERNGESNPELQDYARRRLNQLRPVLHFQRPESSP